MAVTKGLIIHHQLTSMYLLWEKKYSAHDGGKIELLLKPLIQTPQDLGPTPTLPLAKSEEDT